MTIKDANTDQKIIRSVPTESGAASIIILGHHRLCMNWLKGKITMTEMRLKPDITLETIYALQSNNGFYLVCHIIVLAKREKRRRLLLHDKAPA